MAKKRQNPADDPLSELASFAPQKTHWFDTASPEVQGKLRTVKQRYRDGSLGYAIKTVYKWLKSKGVAVSPEKLSTWLKEDG